MVERLYESEKDLVVAIQNLYSHIQIRFLFKYYGIRMIELGLCEFRELMWCT
jgi:hypothetical protein